jgi:hypothetical protein
LKNVFFLLLFLTILSCSRGTEERAVEILEKSIAAHGGNEKWESLTDFSFQKNSWLYDEAGTLESQTQVDHIYRYKPYFEGVMSWEKDSIRHEFKFDGLKSSYRMGSNEIQNPGFLQSRKLDFEGTHYVLVKPFDLLKSAKKLDYLGKTKLHNEVEVEVVQVVDGDPEDPATDVWWYFFDPNTFQLVAYRVKTSGHYAQVYNKELAQQSGLLFPAKRESYRVDSAGNHLYLRAAYTYDNFKLNF